MQPFTKKTIFKLIAIISIISIAIIIPANAYGQDHTLNPLSGGKKPWVPTTTTTVINGKEYTQDQLDQIKAWIAAVEKAKTAEMWRRIVEMDRIYRYNKFMAWAAKKEEQKKKTGYGYVDGILVCNGTTLPTCAIVKRESGFNPRAKNPRSTASGLYQFINGTWRTCGTGYPTAMSAPVSVQVSCAKKIWANGAGASHWRL